MQVCTEGVGEEDVVQAGREEEGRGGREIIEKRL